MGQQIGESIIYEIYLSIIKCNWNYNLLIVKFFFK